MTTIVAIYLLVSFTCGMAFMLLIFSICETINGQLTYVNYRDKWKKELKEKYAIDLDNIEPFYNK